MVYRLVGAKPLSKPIWNIVNWTLGYKLQWNFNRNSNIFIQENAFESVVCEMVAILSRPQCVKCWTDISLDVKGSTVKHHVSRVSTTQSAVDHRRDPDWVRHSKLWDLPRMHLTLLISHVTKWNNLPPQGQAGRLVGKGKRTLKWPSHGYDKIIYQNGFRWSISHHGRGILIRRKLGIW